MASGAVNTVSNAHGGSTVSIVNADGARELVLVCEHASNHIPPHYADLGLGDAALQSHIAWDPGAHGVALHLSALLDAPLVTQNVSRLVYDCNRPPDVDAAMPAVSEIFDVPGNQNLSPQERERRTLAYYLPFADALSAVVDRRLNDNSPPALITIHTFNPTYSGTVRAYDLGILHDVDARLADALLEETGAQRRFDVRRNMPYGPEDGVTHTLKTHALPHGLPNVMIEIRNDLVATADAERHMAEWLAPLFDRALLNLSAGQARGAADA